MWPPAASPLPWSRAKNASRPDPYGFYRPRILQHAGVGFAPELAKKKHAADVERASDSEQILPDSK